MRNPSFKTDPPQKVLRKYWKAFEIQNAGGFEALDFRDKWLLTGCNIQQPHLDNDEFLFKLKYFRSIKKKKEMSDRAKKYEKLRAQLKEGFEWPTVYMFKFIVPADNRRMAKVENLFNTKESRVTTRQSRNGKYISITARELMMSPERVIDRYLEAEKIEGLIAL